MPRSWLSFALRAAVLRLAVSSWWPSLPLGLVALVHGLRGGQNGPWLANAQKSDAKGRLCGTWVRRLAGCCSVTCGLTLRSSGPATACRFRPSFHSGPCAACRRRPLNSNVRRPLSEARSTCSQRQFASGAQPARHRFFVSWAHCAARTCAARASRCRRRRPQRWCLQGEVFADTPVCILASWPPGLGKAARSRRISVPRHACLRSAAGCA